MPRTAILATALALVLVQQASAQSFVETFDAGSNVGGWTAAGTDQVLPDGGHPGAFLNSTVLAYTPAVRSSSPSSPFTGDLRAKGVRSLGVDLRVLAPLSLFGGWRELTLVLGIEQGAPGTWTDDVLVAVNLGFAPRPGEGWRSFDLLIPSDSTTIPPSWYCPGSSPDPDAQWNQVVTNVSYVMFYVGQLEQPYFLQDTWDLGIDNVRVSDELPTSTYCVSKSSSLGCQSPIAFTGTPSVSSSVPFVVQAERVNGRSLGLFVYGYAPRYLWLNTLELPCINGPLARSKLLHAGGKKGTCTGVLALDFNEIVQSGSDPLLSAGAEVFGQFWYRDPAKWNGGSLSNAIQLTIQP